MEPAGGFEPSTCRLRIGCSTPELRRPGKHSACPGGQAQPHSSMCSLYAGYGKGRTSRPFPRTTPEWRSAGDRLHDQLGHDVGVHVGVGATVFNVALAINFYLPRDTY